MDKAGSDSRLFYCLADYLKIAFQCWHWHSILLVHVLHIKKTSAILDIKEFYSMTIRCRYRSPAGPVSSSRYLKVGIAYLTGK